MNSHILRVDQLSKKYGDIEAVDGVSFTVSPGEIVGLLGPNGAGKTTTINMVLGILEPSGGTIEVLGHPLGKNRSDLARQTNFAAVYAQLPANLTVWQNLYIFGLLYGAENVREKVRSALKEFDLEKFSDSKAGVLSSGEASRLNLAKALLNRPKLLLLDEPTASLDPNIAGIIRQKIKDYSAESGAGILWTSHNMREITEVCDRVLFMSRGKILLAGDPRALPVEHQKKDLEELFVAVARESLTPID